MAGCKNEKPQYEMEGRAGFDFGTILVIHDSSGNARATNLAQVYSSLNAGYPYFWHTKFKQFGSRAGFKNSIFEKYVVLPPGITNRWIVGEVFMMNADPYVGPQGKPERGVLSKIDRQYTWQALSEDRIQELFRKARIVEPKPIPMPLPPPAQRDQDLQNPFFTQISNALLGLGQALGLSPEGSVMFRHVIFYSPLVLLPVLAFWLWRRSRR